MDFITKVLPVECISHIISFTSPTEACSSSLVSHDFKSAADSDPVWEKFLPSDYHQIISNADSSTQLLLSSLSKKKLYFHLCDNPILINNGFMVTKIHSSCFIQEAYLIRAGLDCCCVKKLPCLVKFMKLQCLTKMHLFLFLFFCAFLMATHWVLLVTKHCLYFQKKKIVLKYICIHKNIFVLLKIEPYRKIQDHIHKIFSCRLNSTYFDL